MTKSKKPTPPKAKQGAKPVKSTTASCPLANIISIAWLDGDDNKETASATQWVNLPKEKKWVDGSDVKNIDRLGMKPRLKVKFDKKGNHTFKLKLLPPTGTTAYTTSEESRNQYFKYTKSEMPYTTDADGTKIIDGGIQLVAGGGYEFTAQATDKKNKTVKTGKLTTKRLFFYVEAKMKGLTSILSSTSAIEDEYKKHHFKLKKQAALSVARQHNIGSNSDTSTLTNNIDAAINASSTVKTKKPYLLTVTYTDHLAVKNANITISKSPVNVGSGKPKVTIPVTAPGLISPHTTKTRHLWHDLVPSEEWFIEAKFHKSSGGLVDIPSTNVTNGSNWDAVEVDVSKLPTGTGKIEVKVNVVDRMRGGIAISGGNNICVCTRAWWENQPDSEQECTIIHEIGHKLGMVADGTGKLPDKVATHYSGKGHVGDHCHQGCAAGQATYQGAADLTASQCVLFGSVNEKNTYCSNCEKAVKKLDINAGW